MPINKYDFPQPKEFIPVIGLGFFFIYKCLFCITGRKQRNIRTLSHKWYTPEIDY